MRAARSQSAAGLTAAVFLVSAMATACSPSQPATASTASDASIVRLAPENVTTAMVDEISSGPIVSGQLTPARQASVRAQVGGSIVALAVDRGQMVRAGAEIARISARDLEASRTSALAAVRSAETSLEVAKSEADRTASLVKGGALAARDLEQAQNGVSAAEAQLAASQARVTSVDQLLADTFVRAPFDGIVSARPASIGDVVTPGAELLTIIDPSSMRLEALVPSDQVPAITRGAKVRFTIRGAPGDFIGTIDRINPTADPITRQVSCFVTLPNSGGRLIAGLFAEGRVESVTHRGIVVPIAAVDETGTRPTVTRVTTGKAEIVPVTLGPRQPDTERVELLDGISAGDVLVVGSARNIAAGTPVQVIQ